MLAQEGQNNDIGPKVLVLAPTRELVQQISEMTTEYWHNVACAFGGGGRNSQARKLKSGKYIIVAIKMARN